MNQNTLLAIVLSVAVLFGYETVFVAPKRAQMLKNSQLVDIKKDTNIIGKTPSPATEISKQTTEVRKDIIKWDLQTPTISKSVSNLGGSLQNIKIGNGHPFPLTEIAAIKGLEAVEFQLASQDQKSIGLSYANSDLRVTNNVQSEDEYTTKVRMEISNLKTMSILPEFNLIGIDGSTVDPNNQRETMLDEYSVYDGKKILRKNNAYKFNPKDNKSQEGEVQWAGFRDHYSVVVVHPEFKTKSFDIQSLTENKLNISAKAADPIPAGGSAVYEFTIFAGPQDTKLMAKYNKKFEAIVAFFSLAPLNAFAMAIYYALPVLYSIFKSWGVCIIVISMIIYGLTYPLTIKSMMSMRRMQQVQPKIKALQERYKADPQKLNAEIMEIYKREKINPLGGCLPMLLQMPIFIALYNVLWRSYYFKGHGFLWIKDLSLPDRLFILPFSLPFLGNEFNILPLLMAGVMFAQQKISAKSMVITDEQQAMQQKMMMYLMPVFMGFVFYKFASGLSLYFTVFYLLSTLTQWKMSKAR